MIVLLKWFAPILVFTTEEIYSLITKSEESIHESSFNEIPKQWNNNDLNEKWEHLYKIKQDANIAIEEKRSKKEIGSSLEAELEIYTNSYNFKLMNELDLAEYFITSKAKKFKNQNEKQETKIIVKKTSGVKCNRCWKIVDKIVSDVTL